MSDLKQIITRISDKVFWEEAERRTDKRLRESELGESKRQYFNLMLTSIAADFDLTTDELLHGKKNPKALRARWRLYLELHHDGWSIPLICQATGHTASRVSHAIKSRGQTPHPYKKEVAS